MKLYYLATLACSAVLALCACCTERDRGAKSHQDTFPVIDLSTIYKPQDLAPLLGKKISVLGFTTIEGKDDIAAIGGRNGTGIMVALYKQDVWPKTQLGERVEVTGELFVDTYGWAPNDGVAGPYLQTISPGYSLKNCRWRFVSAPQPAQNPHPPPSPATAPENQNAYHYKDGKHACTRNLKPDQFTRQWQTWEIGTWTPAEDSGTFYIATGRAGATDAYLGSLCLVQQNP